MRIPSVSPSPRMVLDNVLLVYPHPRPMVKIRLPIAIGHVCMSKSWHSSIVTCVYGSSDNLVPLGTVWHDNITNSSDNMLKRGSLLSIIMEFYIIQSSDTIASIAIL